MDPKEDVPKQVRVRTDPEEGYTHRYDSIKEAADRLGCNKTRAIVVSCDAMGNLLTNLEDALSGADLRPSEKAELAEAISTRYISIEAAPGDVEIEVS